MTGAAADRRQPAARLRPSGLAAPQRSASSAPAVVLRLAENEQAPPVRSPGADRPAPGRALPAVWPRPDARSHRPTQGAHGRLATSASWSGSFVAHAAIAVLGVGLWLSPPPELEAGGEDVIELEVIVASPSEEAVGEAGASPSPPEPDVAIPPPEPAEVVIRPEDVAPPPEPMPAAPPEPQVTIPPPEPAEVVIRPEDIASPLEPAPPVAETPPPEPAIAVPPPDVRPVEEPALAVAPLPPPRPEPETAPQPAETDRREAERAEAQREAARRAEARREAAEREETRRETAREAARREAERDRAETAKREAAADRAQARREAAEGQGRDGRGRDRADTTSASAASASRGRAETAGRAATANYQGQIMAHLARHKRYPEEARAQGARGRAVVRFSIDAGGRVTSVALAGSSGVAALDAETQAMVRRASPFPPIPSEVGRSSMSFTAPVSFSVRSF